MHEQGSEPDVLNLRVTNLEKVVERVSLAVVSIDESLKTLTRLDVKHDETRSSVARAFIFLEDHEKRIRAIEAEMPTVKLTRGWLLAGITGMIGLLGIAIAKLLYK